MKPAHVMGLEIFLSFTVAVLRLQFKKISRPIICTCLTRFPSKSIRRSGSETGEPVLYLEYGLETGSKAAVRRAMENLVRKKAAQLKAYVPGTLAAADSASAAADITVTGIGAYTQGEYVESVWGLRAAGNEQHRGRRLDN